MFKLTKISKEIEKQPLIKDISLTFEGKGVFGILALDGASKECVLNIASGIDANFEGEIELDGKRYTKNSKEKDIIELRKHVGYVPANIPFYGDMTVYELLDFVGNAKKIAEELKTRQIKEAMELTGIYEHRNVIFSNLSSFVKTNVALSAALLGSPSVILLDEPTLGMTVSESESFFDMLSMIGKAKTVIVATKNADIVQALCNNVALIVNGKLVFQNTLSEIADMINATETHIIRIVSKSGGGVEEATALLDSAKGICEVAVRSVSPAGEMNIRLECEKGYTSADLRRLLESGYIVLDDERVTLSLPDLCNALIRKGED